MAVSAACTCNAVAVGHRRVYCQVQVLHKVNRCVTLGFSALSLLCTQNWNGMGGGGVGGGGVVV